MLDMTDEWNGYRCRDDVYPPETLEGFVDDGTATDDPDDDSYTITATRGEGTVETWTVRNAPTAAAAADPPSCSATS